MVKWVVWASVKEKTVIIVCVPGSAWGSLESLWDWVGRRECCEPGHHLVRYDGQSSVLQRPEDVQLVRYGL